MLKLSNGKKIDEEGIISAMGGDETGKKYFLDSLLGEVIIAENESTMSEFKNKKRYFLIPEVDRVKQLSWLKEAVAEVMSREDEKIFKLLSKAFVRGKSYDQCIDLIKQTDESWIYGWNSWRGDCLYDEMLDWLESLPIKIKEEQEFFDDCPICRAMKEGRDSLEELKDAFREAKEQGGIVGGELFEEEEDSKEPNSGKK